MNAYQLLFPSNNYSTHLAKGLGLEFLLAVIALLRWNGKPSRIHEYFNFIGDN